MNELRRRYCDERVRSLIEDLACDRSFCLSMGLNYLSIDKSDMQKIRAYVQSYVSMAELRESRVREEITREIGHVQV